MERTVVQHVIDGGKNGGGDGADRLLRAAPTFQPMELRGVVAVLLAFGRPCALHEHGLQPGRALAQARGLTLAGTLVLARAQPGPGDQMPGGREAAHVAADLGEDRRRREDTDAGDRAQQQDQLAKGHLSVLRRRVHALDPSIDLPIDVLDRRIRCIPLCEMQLQQEAVMIGQPPMQSIVEFLGRRLDAAMGQGRQLMRVAHAGDHGLDHPPAADAHDVADHRVESDVGLCQRLLDALHMPRLLAHQLACGCASANAVPGSPRPARSSPGSARTPADRRSTSHRSCRSCGREPA